MAETAYVILKSNQANAELPPVWTIESTNVPAASAEAAIKLACKTDKAAAGTYVAVPARSWKPTTVRVEQTTTIKFGEAT